jgi:hypothetical protein
LHRVREFGHRAIETVDSLAIADQSRRSNERARTRAVKSDFPRSSWTRTRRTRDIIRALPPMPITTRERAFCSY